MQLFFRALRWCICLSAVPLMLGVDRAHGTPITDGLALWLDASDSSTLFQDVELTTPAAFGDPVGGWMDKSGNDFHATQSVADSRPVFEESVMNGAPALRFTAGQSDGMIIDQNLEVQRPFTAFIVNQYWGATRGRTLQSTSENWLHGLWAGNISHYADGFVSSNFAAVNDTVYVSDAVDDSGFSSFTTNGLDMTSNDTFVGQPFGLALTGAGAFPEFSDADIAEVIVYDRALADNELTEVRNFLYDKYQVDLLTVDPPNTVNFGSLGVITGGDPGEGLDLQGTFQYAVNVSGPGGLSAGDASFTDDDVAGVTITAENIISPLWLDPTDLGDSPADNGIEGVLNSIRWSAANGNAIDTVKIELDGIIPGADYKLQLLFAERCCDRGFDINIDGETAVRRFHAPSIVGTPEEPDFNDLNEGAVFTHEFQGEGETLEIELDGRQAFFPDGNALIQGFTLEVSIDLPGDFNFDGVVDLADFDALLNGIFQGNNYADGDINLDGVVDFADFRAFKEAFTPGAAVPEPGSWLLALLGLAALAFHRLPASRRS